MKYEYEKYIEILQHRSLLVVSNVSPDVLHHQPTWLLSSSLTNVASSTLKQHRHRPQIRCVSIYPEIAQTGIATENTSNGNTSTFEEKPASSSWGTHLAVSSRCPGLWPLQPFSSGRSTATLPTPHYCCFHQQPIHFVCTMLYGIINPFGQSSLRSEPRL